MSKLAKSLAAAAGNAGADAPNVEKVFSTYLYEGTGSTQTITNGIDLAGEGGMVWIKRRGIAFSHVLADSERSGSTYLKYLSTDNTDGESTTSSDIRLFNSDGFEVGSSNGVGYTTTYASWTFRKAPRFFDVVTYTGNGGTAQSISHNLGVTPGLILVKRTDSAFKWFVYHRSTGASKYLQLNETAAAVSYGGYWDSTSPTDTAFTIGTDVNGNASGGTYVAYLFAHDPDGENDDGMIACGSFTTNASRDNVIDIGWEAQYVLTKETNNVDDWRIWDVQRGMSLDSSSGQAYISANTATQEGSTGGWVEPNSTGFQLGGGGYSSGDEVIYMAIRAPMMVEPEAGSEVFAVDNGNGSDIPAWTSGFPVDMVFWSDTTGDNHKIASRLTGARVLETDTTGVEVAQGSHEFDYSDGFYSATRSSVQYAHMFKRAKGFFDVVAYKGGTAPFEVKHSLGVPPEMMWIKNRITVDTWAVYHGDATKYLVLNTSAASANSLTYLGGSMWSYPAVEPTSTAFTLGGSGLVNNNSTTPYIAYLFASLDGISKVGSYTGTGVAGSGTPLNIDCGFSNGARFVLIKRTDDVGSWYFWDTTRGIVTGNDSTLRLDVGDAESTSYDAIDPYSAGFTINATGQDLNNLNAEYIFLAIA